jgi:hypothetical protein
MTRLKTLPFLLSLLLCAACATTDQGKGTARKTSGVKITKDDKALNIKVNGDVFAVYNFAADGSKRPFFYPVYGPSGKLTVRNWPMKEVPNEERDHPHHQGIWFGHREVNGMTFWDNNTNGGYQVHEKFLEVSSGKDSGQFTEKVRWDDKNGKEVCRDVRIITILNKPEGYFMDFEITLFATGGPLHFGDDKDGLMAIRVAESMRLKVPKVWNDRKAGTKQGEGHIVVSDGSRDESAWGKKGPWCDYYGPVDGQTIGVAIFDHPDNLRHPTWWHVRDYGLFAANPFGKRHFENLKDTKAGEFELPAGKSITFKYRFYFHVGNEVQARVADHYADYVRETSVRLTSR